MPSNGTSAKKRLVFVSTALGVGGAELVLLQLVQRLRDRFSISVITLATVGAIGERVVALGIPVLPLNMQSPFDAPKALVRIRSALRRTAPDVIQTWMYHADLLGGLAARLNGNTPVVWGVRNSTLDAATSKPTTRFVRWLCARLSVLVPTDIVFCSEKAREEHVTCGYRTVRSTVIHNGIDLERFVPSDTARGEFRREFHIPDNAPVVGVVGRFDPQKNHLGFVEAASLVLRSIPSAIFVFAGEGLDMRNSVLVSAVHKHGLAKSTRLLGLRNDIPTIMAGLDLLVSSSLYGEAFPNVIAEAMATGVPCVATDLGDASHIIGDCGWVVPPGDTTSMVRAIAQGLIMYSAMDRKVIQGRNRQRIAEHFDASVMAARYEEVYMRLCQRPA